MTVNLIDGNNEFMELLPNFRIKQSYGILTFRLYDFKMKILQTML